LKALPLWLLVWLCAAAAPSNRRGRRHPNPNASAARRWASIPDTAAYLGIGVRTVREMIRDGRITAYRGLGNRVIRVDLNEVDTAMAPDAAAG
jgi:excisionase family DNA binding protein